MPDTTTQKLIELMCPLVQPLGYEVVYLEVIPRQKVLRVFIDHLDRTDGVGIQDCVTVAKALDEPLDQMAEINSIFGEAGYELEVSSPGIDRPLRASKDFERFKGREVRIHVLRPLVADELGNVEYASKNPKQKNFLGTLKGLERDRVVLAVNLTGGQDKTQGKNKKNKSDTNSAEVVVSIPLPLISKANLEPDFNALAGHDD